MADTKMLEYKYSIVGDMSLSTWEVTDYLRDGWTIDRATSTSQAVHYVLVREMPVPEPILVAPEQEQLPETAVDDAPIDLTDVPF